MKFTFPFSRAISPDEMILCIDVGGTRIKHCLIPSSFADLVAMVETGTFPKLNAVNWDCSSDSLRRGSLQHGISDIIRKNLAKTPITQISISITGGVSSNGLELNGWLMDRGAPHNLVAEVQHALVKRHNHRGQIVISLSHDSYAWGNGVRNFYKLSGKATFESIGILALGTGIGFSILTPTSVIVRELSDTRYNWGKLFKKAGHADDQNYRVHAHLAKEYVEWAKSQNWSDDFRLSDMADRLNFVMDEISRVHGLRKFIVCGGYSHYYEKAAGIISSEKASFLTDSTIGHGTNCSGIIPMLGIIGF